MADTQVHISADANWIIKKSQEYQQKISIYFDCVAHIKLWNVLRKMGNLEHHIVLM